MRQDLYRALRFLKYLYKKSAMSVYRTYFQKNNTLIQNNELNVSQNPVGEITYGTLDATVSRIIFKLDLDSLVNKIITSGIDINRVQSHTLVMTNTIASRPDLLGGLSYSQGIERASSFELELFEITEDWDEGSGYEFHFNDDALIDLPKQASNWYYRKTGLPWTVDGAYISSGTTGLTGATGSSTIIASQYFEKGNEDIKIDLTSYINYILTSGSTDNTLGLKMNDLIESIETLKRRSVAFHLKNTHTFFEPYLETVVNDQIADDRNHFIMDKDNDIYLYSSKGDVAFASGVTIYDYNDQIYTVIPISGITRIKSGVYKITVNVDSDTYPDAVIFKDIWTVIVNGKEKEIINEFYLINSDSFYTFGLSNRLNPDNFHFSFFGLKSGENLKRGDLRRIDINVKQLYKTPESNSPLNLEYRLFIKQSSDVQIDVIPFTKVDRTVAGYEFILDTSWLIPQDYYLELKISDGTVFNTKEAIGFTIVSDEAFTKS